MYDPNEELPDEQYNKKNTSISLGVGIERLIKSYKLKGKYNESLLKSKWTDIVGETIAKRTAKIFLYEETLILTITSPPLQHELKNSTQRLISRINEVMEGLVVSKIVIK